MQLIKMAFRTIRRNRAFTAINVVGLALGIAVFLLIAEFVSSEWSSNRMHANFNQLHRVVSISKEGNSYYLPPGYSNLIRSKFPEVKAAVRVADGIAGGVISTTEFGSTPRNFRLQEMIYVDGDFLNIFSFPVLKGNPSLKAPQTMAISESMARKLFDTEDVVGRTVLVSNQFGNTPYTIAAVMNDITDASDIRAEILLSIHTLESAKNRDGNDWADPNTLESGFVNIYCLLNAGASPDAFSKKLTKFVHSLDPKTAGSSIALQPFKYLHLGPDLGYPYQTFGSLKFVYLLGLVGLLILVIAWVNYINLSTVQAMKRAKEAGVRKVLGASRSQLAFRFLSETFLITVISVIISIMMVQLLQPLFNQFTGKSLSLAALNNGWFLGFAFAIIFTGCLLSGGYVAFVLSSFKPISSLKGKIESSSGGILVRKGLVVFQFSISIIFIIATIILYKQLSYMRTEALGMQLKELLVIQGPTVSSEGQAERNMAFKSELRNLSFVKKMAASNNVPGRGYNFSTEGITGQVPAAGDEKKSYNMFIADQNFFDTYGIQFIAGGAFSEDDAIRSWNNARKVILNEKAATQLGFSSADAAIGKKILWGEPYEVAGVIKDYHHLSLRSVIAPVIYLPSVSFSYFTVQTDATNLQSKIRTIEKLYKNAFPGNPFEYFFADESYDQQYRQEKELGNVFIAATLIAIFIACLGLFGLAAFSAQQRIKEIGIRKVLGASITDVTALLSKDFIWLVILAILIGSPVAWWSMNAWLQEFPFRTGIDWWVFAVAGSTAVVIALSTISFQAIKAARMNPVKSLRTE